jgi:hypothetical protein
MKHKKCTICLKNKNLISLYKKKGGKLGLDARCKLCVSFYHKQHFQKNKDTILQNRSNYMDEYRKNNKDHISEYNRNYYEKNKQKLMNKKASPKYRELSRKYEKNKRQNNSSFRILGSLRSRLRIAIKNHKKNGTTKELIGCDIGYLKDYLEQKFVEGMTWDNYGKNGWHIDHIMPCSSFDLSNPEEQRKCFHYTNLQPLWAKDNISKSDKIL